MGWMKKYLTLQPPTGPGVMPMVVMLQEFRQDTHSLLAMLQHLIG